MQYLREIHYWNEYYISYVWEDQVYVFLHTQKGKENYYHIYQVCGADFSIVSSNMFTFHQETSGIFLDFLIYLALLPQIHFL